MPNSFPAEISNLDCTNLTDSDKVFLRQQLDQHKLLVIRGQNLSKSQQVDFTSVFGTPDLPWTKEDPEEPRIQMMNNKNDNHVYEWRQEKTSIVRIWHVDNSFMQDPVRYTMLHVKTIPPTGGDTKFIYTQLAYADLDPELKTKIDNSDAFHSFKFIAGKWKERKDVSTYNFPDITHPLVMQSKNGSKSLYLSKLGISHIAGFAPQESDRLLTVLFEHCKKEKYRYRHKWHEGDLLIWDNAATMHKATFCDPQYLRELNRTNIRFSQAPDATVSKPRLRAGL